MLTLQINHLQHLMKIADLSAHLVAIKLDENSRSICSSCCDKVRSKSSTSKFVGDEDNGDVLSSKKSLAAVNKLSSNSLATSRSISDSNSSCGSVCVSSFQKLLKSSGNCSKSLAIVGSVCLVTVQNPLLLLAQYQINLQFLTRQ